MSTPVSTPDADWRPTTLSVASWVTYDLANTIFALGVSGLYFASWFTDEGWPDGGLAVAIASAMVVVIVLSPWIGARSDHSDRRVRYLIPTTLTAVVATFFLASASVAVSLALYVIAVIGFNLGSVIYDSLLPDVSTPENRGFVSGLGVGIGYVGSIVAVGIGALLLDRFGYPAVFRSIAVAFLVFALPAFFFIRERPRVPPPGQPAALRSSLRKLVSSWRLARTYQGVVPFLLGRFLYTDAINTLIGGFLTIYVKQELDFSDSEVEALLALSILTAIIGGLTGGKLTDRRGPRRQLHMALYLWIAGIAGGILAVLLDMPLLVWTVGAVGGFALGATWTADRVYMARISPPRHLGEFYGLYATVGRFATILGPLMWAFIVNVIGWPRTVAMGALVVFLIAGRLILRHVDDTPREWAPQDLATIDTT